MVAPARFSVCKTLEMTGSLDGVFLKTAPKFRNGLFQTGNGPVSHREHFRSNRLLNKYGHNTAG